MHKPMPPLNALRAFEAAARHLSLTKAAQELHVTAGALSHQIRGLEALLGLHFLDAKVYFITDLPARVEWSDVLQISLTAFGLCCLSTLYPSWRAARTQPAQSLRHE